ncbi:MAG: drug resistance transporter, EmrB/QacA subfamily, partial [Frankiales bacterium]|nr:drug resistance transporter, EmrB/QacA subfamily [Frankiales bacterium]
MRFAPHVTLHHHAAVHTARHTGDRRHEHVDGPPASPYLGLGIILSATFVQLLDASIVTVAVPAIQADLGASFASIQLMIAVYVLAFACTLVTAARLGDIHGRKRLFLIGMAGFTVASALCGLAPSATVLVLSRGLQGVMSGLMFPQVLSVIQVTFRPEERGKALGIFGAVIGLATTLGPLLGGALIELDVLGLGWRAIFLVNLPIGLAALALAVPFLTESRSPQADRLDLVGALLVVVGLFLVIFPLVEGRARGWPLWIWAMLAGSAVVLTAFVAYERRLAQRAGSPLMAVDLFAERAFDTGLVVTVLFFSGLTSFFFTLMLYLQIGFSFSALEAGLTTLPFALAVGVASGASDGLTARLGRGVLLLGALGMAGGFTVLALTVAAADTGVSGWQLVPGMALAGLGTGLFVAPLTGILLAHIAPRDIGSASGVFTTTQEFAGALGLALIGVVFFGFLAGNADRSVDQVAPGLRGSLSAA